MKKSLSLCLALVVLSGCSLFKRNDSDDIKALALFQQMTQGKSQLEVRTGIPYQFSGSEKQCVQSTCAQGDKDCKPTDHFNGSPLMKSSDFNAYYGLSTGPDGYSHYAADSQYARDVATLVADMDRLMASFRDTGMRQALERDGRHPALMFDLDNTLEFSAAPDYDPKGAGPAIAGVVDFAKRWCFKDGVDCYFVTARNCDAVSAAPTAIWAKANLGLSDEQLGRYVFFSRNQTSLTCDVAGKPQIAYKDVVREALERDRKVFWLMSVGDQLTDSLGEHSGMKVRVPNQFFHSDIVPNQYAPWGAGQCGSPQTIAPPRDCAESLVGHALQVTGYEYCKTQH